MLSIINNRSLRDPCCTLMSASTCTLPAPTTGTVAGHVPPWHCHEIDRAIACPARRGAYGIVSHRMALCP